jgi:hypothetical protein
MTKSCKSQGRKNKTMKKNTKKMQGGLNNFGGPDPTPKDSNVVKDVPTDAKNVVLTAVKDDSDAVKVDSDAVKVDSDSTTTTTTDNPESKVDPNASKGVFGFLSGIFTSAPKPTGAKTGGKRKSKSNKSYKKKSKYNKK